MAAATPEDAQVRVDSIAAHLKIAADELALLRTEIGSLRPSALTAAFTYKVA